MGDIMSLAGKNTVSAAAKPAALVRLKAPYLLFLGDITDSIEAKTAFGLRDWAGEKVVGQWRLTPEAVDLGLDEFRPTEAVQAGARSVIVGAAPAGGKIPDHWIAALCEAASAGLDIVSGMHSMLESFPVLEKTAHMSGATLVNVRQPPTNLPIGSGAPRAGKRLLTVGVDCAVGKKYAALSLAREMTRRGWNCDFCATGQTGIMIAGTGLPLDAIISDFLSGAAETLTPAADPDHWDVIEGQGSIFHPSYAAVSVGLLHGAQPDALVLCIDPERSEIDGCPGYPIVEPEIALARHLDLATLTNPASRFVGIAANTNAMQSDDASRYLEALTERTNLPSFDPIRTGAGAVIDFLDA